MGGGRQVSEARVRVLEASEAELVCAAIAAVYGDTYEVPWLYDRHQIASRIARGVLVSAVAELDGRVVCHAALTLRHPHDRVGHAGQAVTLPEARGHHLFTAVKRHLADESRRRGLIGMYSEATAAHPYSQRANVDLGAHETGFLLGFIGASVRNSVSSVTRRQSAALFYLSLGRGPGRPVYVPDIYRDVVHQTVSLCRFHGRLADPPRHPHHPDKGSRTALHTLVDAPANRATVTVREPGADTAAAVASARDRLFQRGYDAVYVDLPLELSATARVGRPVREAGFSFAGIFPDGTSLGDVLRMQAVRSGCVSAADVQVASPHGEELLGFVVEDLRRSGHQVVGVEGKAATSHPVAERRRPPPG